MSADPHYDQWVEDAGRGSVPDVHDWEDDLPTAGELVDEWIAENLPAAHRRVFRDAADRDWAVGGPTCGGRLR